MYTAQIQTNKVILTDTQYKVLTDLFNECHEEFWRISEEKKQAFFTRLYGNANNQVYRRKVQS